MGNGRNQLLSRWTAVFVPLLFFVYIAVANLADAQQSAERGTRTPLPAEVARPASPYKYKALHDFCRAFDCPDGLAPNGDLIFDAAGNLYGTTFGGGDFSPCQAVGCGTVFQLSPEGNGTWKHTILHEFHSEFEAQPSAGLVMDAAGNLYGPIACAGGCGAVFELSRQGNGPWRFATIFTFTGKNGLDPQAHLILDAAGNLYGTTVEGGNATCSSGCGTVFELSPKANGAWKLTTLFKFNGTNGASPYAPLIFDAAGNLYGTTAGGGNTAACSGGCGTVFELSPNAHRAWKHRALFKFNGTNGAGPEGGLVFDSTGNLFGTTQVGGKFNIGTVFKLSPEGNGTWKHTTLLAFDIQNGSFPTAGLIFDAAGNLYGNAQDGGFGVGIVYRLSPKDNGTWKETTLLTFNDENGSQPVGDLLLDAAGNLYGSAYLAGKHSGGVVFELSPK